MRIEQTGKEIGYMVTAQVHAGVEPSLGMHRRHVGGGINIGRFGQRAVGGQ